MPCLPRIGDWPFPSEEEVLLLWLRSPHRSLRGRQWRLDACFRPANGSPRELEMPWGALPQLALGLTYLDGYVVEEKPAWGTSIDFEVPHGVHPETRPARAVLPPDVLAGMVGAGAGGDENCLVLDLPEQRIVLPVLEVIRTLLCPNRTLASGLLEPEYLRRIIASHEVKEKTLHLGFTAEDAPAALDQAVARRLGRLLYDDSFRRAWEAVERGRFHAAGPSLPRRRVPLDCPLPDLDPHWRVRAMPVDVAGTWLVLEILSVGTANDLPFERVIFTHPKLSRTLKADAPAGTGAKGEGGSGPADASAGKPAGSSSQGARRVSIERSDRAPRDSHRPRRAGIIVSGLVGDQRIEVHKLATRTRTRRRGGQGGSPAPTTTTAPAAGPALDPGKTTGGTGQAAPAATAKLVDKGEVKPREVPVSLSSAARDGATPAGEYKVVEPPPGPPPKPMELRPLPLVCKTHEGLDRLAASLGHLATMCPDWTIEWGLTTLEVNIPYLQMGSQKRQYALVRCSGAASSPPPPACWLLEFARLDGRAPSTLLFFPGRNDGSDDTPEGDEEVRRRVPRLVREVLAATLKEKGWWDQPELMKFHHSGRMRFDLVSHHFSRKPLDWAERLEKRIRQARQSVAKP